MSELFWVWMVVSAVFGTLTAAYCLLERLLRPKEEAPLLMFYAPGSQKSLLALCDRVGWLRRWGVDTRLYILEDTLDEETRKIALLLAREDRGFELCRTEELCAYVAGDLGGSNPFGGV